MCCYQDSLSIYHFKIFHLITIMTPIKPALLVIIFTEHWSSSFSVLWDFFWYLVNEKLLKEFGTNYNSQSTLLRHVYFSLVLHLKISLWSLLHLFLLWLTIFFLLNLNIGVSQCLVVSPTLLIIHTWSFKEIVLSYQLLC